MTTFTLLANIPVTSSLFWFSRISEPAGEPYVGDAQSGVKCALDERLALTDEGEGCEKLDKNSMAAYNINR